MGTVATLYLASEALRINAKEQQAATLDRRRCRSEKLQNPHRPRHPLHSSVGQSCRRARSRPRHHGRLEAHRGYGRRKNRQEPSHLRTRSRCGNHRHGHHRRRRCIRPSRQYHTRTFIGRSWHHGRQPLRPSVGHRPQLAHGLGTHSSRGHDAFRAALLDLPQNLLGGNNQVCGERIVRTGSARALPNLAC